MRYTFLSSSYQIFVAFVVALATALITTSWNTGIIEARWRGDRAAAADDRVDVATLDKPWTPISIQTSQPAPLRIGNLYQAQHPNAPRPNASAKSNDLTSNLFYALMYYGHPPQEHEGDRLTHEYERESGGGRVVAAMPWQDVLIQHLAYLAALELHHELYPEIALFNQERANMHRIAKLAIAKAPSIDDIARDPAADVQPYWLARRIAEL
ncbi:MAG TPA: hypothetical protein VEI97_14400, partial [bacterium]|nr:hypothetical protein [bacterium]